MAFDSVDCQSTRRAIKKPPEIRRIWSLGKISCPIGLDTSEFAFPECLLDPQLIAKLRSSKSEVKNCEVGSECSQLRNHHKNFKRNWNLQIHEDVVKFGVSNKFWAALITEKIPLPQRRRSFARRGLCRAVWTGVYNLKLCKNSFWLMNAYWWLIEREIKLEIK